MLRNLQEPSNVKSKVKDHSLASLQEMISRSKKEIICDRVTFAPIKAILKCWRRGRGWRFVIRAAKNSFKIQSHFPQPTSAPENQTLKVPAAGQQRVVLLCD